MDIQLGFCLWVPGLSRPPHLFLKHMLFALNSFIDALLPVLIVLGVLRMEAASFGFEMALDLLLSATNIALYLLYSLSGFVRPFKFTLMEYVTFSAKHPITLAPSSTPQLKVYLNGVYSPDSFVNTELGGFDKDIQRGRRY